MVGVRILSITDVIQNFNKSLTFVLEWRNLQTNSFPLVSQLIPISSLPFSMSSIVDYYALFEHRSRRVAETKKRWEAVKAVTRPMDHTVGPLSAEGLCGEIIKMPLVSRRPRTVERCERFTPQISTDIYLSFPSTTLTSLSRTLPLDEVNPSFRPSTFL